MPGSIAMEGVSVKAGRFPVLRAVNFSVGKGSVAIISGRSGGGKSMLLEILIGLRRPDHGSVLWDGREITAFSRETLLSERQKVGYMFQTDSLIANYPVFDNIALPLRIGGANSEPEVTRRVMRMLEEVALFGVEGALPESLSVGQRKRAALARALVTDPELLLLDEPTSGVDAQTAAGLKAVLQQALAVRERTAVIISHESTVWDGIPAEHYVLEAGKLHAAEGVAGSADITSEENG